MNCLKDKIINMRTIFFLFSGFTVGIWISWPGVFVPNNWICFKNIITRSLDEKISLKAALAVSPNYLLKRKRKDKASKIRIISDACFR